MLKSTDPTWTITGAMYWSAIETNIGILAASIPSFKAVAQRYLPRIIGEYGSRSRNKEYEMHNSKDSSQPQRSRPGHNRSKSERDSKYGVGRSVSDEESRGSDSTSSRLSKSARTTVVGVENGSEERLNLPTNRILTTTEITTTSQQTPAQVVGEPLSFYVHSDDESRPAGVPRAGV